MAKNVNKKTEAALRAAFKKLNDTQSNNQQGTADSTKPQTAKPLLFWRGNKGVGQ